MNEIKIPSLLEMLKAGVHFGHRSSKRHPKMTPYIFAEKNGVHIINLEKTQQKLSQVLVFVGETAAQGGTILFVGTKQQAKELVKNKATECGMPYVIERWIGGTLTNFKVIKKLFSKLEDLEKKQKAVAGKYTKKEKLVFSREAKKLNVLIGGIRELKEIPQAIFVLDVKQEKTAVREAQRKKIPIIAICDTNVNPQGIDYPIPANDDAIKSLIMITGLVAEAIKSNKQSAGETSPVVSVTKEKLKEQEN